MSEENLIDVMGLGAGSFEPAQPDPLGANLARAHLSPISNRIQNVNLADSIGSTLDYASVNRADIMRRRALEAIDPQAIRAQTPAFAEWAAKDEANAVMSVNDMGWFQSAEHILKSAANEFEVGVASSEASRLDAYEALARLTGTPGLNEADKARLASLRSGIDSAGSYSGTGGIFSDAIISAAQIAPSLLDVVSQTAKGGAVGAGVGSLAGSVVPGVGTIAGLISGATTGASAGAIESSAMLNFGSMVREFSQLKDENGNLIDQNTADIAAAIATLPVAALDRFSNGKMTALIPDILNIKEQLARYGLRNAVKIPTVKSALIRGARDYVTSVGTEAVTEGLQQGIQATARYLVNPDANKQFDAASIMAEMGSAAYQAGLGTAVIGIPGGAINTRNMVNNVRAGERDPEVIAQRTASLHEHMQSKTGQESLNTSAPRLRDFMKSADGGAQVFIDPKPMQELFQSLPDDTRKVLLDALPGFQGQLEEAAAADTDIIMRRGDYAALFASQPWSEPLIPHVRENQLDVSAAELKALIENKDIQNDIDQAASMERLETRLQRRLQDSIQNAGVTPSIANTQSRLLERFIGRTDRLRSLAGETGDISAKLERALSFRRSASEYVQPERIDELTQHLTNIKARMATEKAPARVSRKNFPVLNYIVKTAGGIDPSGSFGRELAAQDVTPKTHPWIFKKGGVGEIDALDATSLKNAFPALNLETSDLGKYSVNDLHEIIRQELKNPSMNKEETARSAAEDNLMSLLDEGLGLSLKEIEALTPEKLRELLAEYEAGGRSEDSNQFDQAANGKTPHAEPTITVDGKERPTTNSNGKPIAATKEGLENFWRWFSDSRVTDADGKPLVVYHGSPETFDTFDLNKVGGRGFYFAKRKDFADTYAKGISARTVEAYVAIIKPMSEREFNTLGIENGLSKSDAFAFTKENGYDGLIGDRVVVAFNPNQIKSATGNNGNFSPTDANILHQSDTFALPSTEIYALSTKHFTRKLLNAEITNRTGLDASDPKHAAIKNEVNRIESLRKKRRDDAFKSNNDPLELARRNRKLNLDSSRALKEKLAYLDGKGLPDGDVARLEIYAEYTPVDIFKSYIDKYIRYVLPEQHAIDTASSRLGWSKTSIAEVQSFHDLYSREALENIRYINTAAVKATLEAVQREAKKRGYTLRHASGKASAKNASSIYLIDPDTKKEVRVSDHELPDTKQRQSNRETFGPPKWDGEFIIGRDWKTLTLEQIFDKIKEAGEDGTILYQEQSATDPDAAPIFYSQVAKVVENLKQNKATAEQWLKTIQNTPGVKQEELDWMGLPEWLAAQQGPVTKQEVVDFIAANQITVDEVVKGDIPQDTSALEARTKELADKQDSVGLTKDEEDEFDRIRGEIFDAEAGDGRIDTSKFSQYVLPGGSNYRELLMTLPGNEFGSSHFDEKGIVAHIRFNERTDADGKRVLFVEEIQSDMHQAGRDKGYKGDPVPTPPTAVPEMTDTDLSVRETQYQYIVQTVDRESRFYDKEVAVGKGVVGSEAEAKAYALRMYNADISKANQAAADNYKYSVMARQVPDAPFKTTWPELAFKRALRWAVDNGFDRVAWTTGEQQADRYDLSKQVDEIRYAKNDDGTYNIVPFKDGEALHGIEKENVKEGQLEDFFGKDVAKRIIEGKGDGDGAVKSLSGENLKVGGEGMRTFYDKMLPSMVNKLVKKWGGKVGETTFKGWGSIDKGRETFNAHSLEITPEMRAAAQAGLALFQETRGSISFDNMLEKVVISLSSGANLSTMLHEFGHYASLLHRQTAQIARDALAAGKVTDPAARAELEQVIKDWDTLKKKLGVTGDTLTVDQEEQIAKWFEQYLREGKSPSAELNDIFATFKSWMLQIYKTIKDLGKPLNDDVRQVFDRWLASDEEIKAAQSVNLQIEQIAAQFDMLDATGLSKEQAEARAAVGAKVARLLNKSGNRAGEALLAEVLKEESKKQTEEYKVDYAKTLADVTKEADESRVYAAQEHIRAGHQMDAKLVEQVVGKDIAKRLPNGLRGGTAHPDMIAMQFGYIDGAEMIREIVSNVPKKVFIAQETERLMQARHGNMLEDGRAAERARVLVANDEVGEAIELLVKTSGEKKQTRRLVKAAARQRMLNTRYADITPGKYSAARDKALRAAYAAGTKAKGGDAAQHLWKAMLNHELLMAANQAKADQAKAQKLYDKINKKDTKLPDSWDAEYVYFARYLLANAGLSTNRGFNPNKWLVDAQERNPELMGQLAEAYKDFMPEKNWKSMTALELSSLHMVVQNIIHIGRENKAFVRAGEKTTIENALSEIVQSLQSQGYSTVQPPLPSSMTMGAKAAKVLYDMEGSLVRIEALCKHLDGGNSFGPMSQSIYRPISDAVNRGKPISNAFITKLAKVMAEREAEYSSSGSIAAPELFSEHFNGVFRNKWDVIACLLNYGNASSATKLIDGYKWNEDDLLGVFNKHLNARDVEFVQRIWDVLNEVKPYVKEEYYQRTGLSLVEIEPRPFDLHGQTWRGGYYPVAYSREHVANSKIGERADLDQSLFGAEGSSWPAPNKGSSIERTGYVGPIDLNPMVSVRHVEQSIHRWAVAKDIRQTARLVNRPEFQSAMAAINPSYRGLFMPWLRAVARDTVDDAAMTSWDKAAKILRNRATVMIMGLNLRNAMQNLSGYPIVSREIGGKYFMEGMASYAENPQAATDFIFERSAEMKMRYQNLDREQQEVLRDIAAGKKTAIGKLNSKIQPYAFALSNATDALVSRPAWLGAYKKAKAENKSDADAAYYADSVVRLNVGIGNVKDVAALQRGNQFARTTLVMFYSYMNMVYNLNRSDFLNLKRTGASGIPSFLAGQMLVNIIPNLIAAGIVDALGGGGAGADDEDWMWWYARRVFSGMFGLVPIVGDFGELIIDEATNEKFFDRFQNPVFSMLGTIGSAVIGDGEAFFQEDPNYSQVVKTTITAMAGAFGTPINDLRHPLGALADWAEGDSEPVGVWQAVQQLMGAPPPKD